MFVVLRIFNAQEHKIKRKQKSLIMNSQIVPHSTEKGLPFFTLDVLETKKGIDWRSISEKCGRYSSRIIAPRDLCLPDINNIRRFIPRFITPSLIFNTAAQTIEKARLSPDEITITLTDRNAVMASRVCRLLPFASQVRIITIRPEKYASACIKAMDEHGATLIVRPSYEATSNGNDIVICCDGVTTPAMENAAVFSDRRKNGCKLNFRGSGLPLLPVHSEMIPDNIDPLDFADALFELCGCTAYIKSSFSTVETSCNQCEKHSPEKCLNCFSDITKRLQIR